MVKERMTYKSFGEWKGITYTSALLWARGLFRAITNIPEEVERVRHINSRLRGVQFSLEDLK